MALGIVGRYAEVVGPRAFLTTNLLRAVFPHIFFDQAMEDLNVVLAFCNVSSGVFHLNVVWVAERVLMIEFTLVTMLSRNNTKQPGFLNEKIRVKIILIIMFEPKIQE